MNKEQWELAFEDWERLLKVAGAEDLLNDPKAIWDEAWRQALIINQQASGWRKRQIGDKND